MDVDDRREYPRLPLTLRVEYADRQNYFGEWTENVSHGGLFVATDLAFELKSKIRLSLSFPGLLDPVEIEGKVAWRRPASKDGPAGIGVQVHDERYRKRLTDLALLAGQRGGVVRERPYRVIVAEDNPHIVRGYERVLKHISEISGDQMTVQCAANGHDAAVMVREATTDLLITDLYMPVMDGAALIRELRDSPATANLPIIVITAAGGETETLLAGLKVDALMKKPIQFAPVLETIACLLRVRAP